MNAADMSLLLDVKNHLNITWEDEETDRKIGDLIASGIAYLNRRCGEEADYSAAGLPRTLLIQYVRYARDEALDVFEQNYETMLIAMQNDKAVERYEKTAVSAEG